jgi:dolichyl-phosphate beta-glucosyltransferase
LVVENAREASATDPGGERALEVSIVIPAFNEAPRLPDRAARLADAVAIGVIDPWTTELIVVDDGSTDETARVAQELLAPAFPRLRILRLDENSGKGAAIRVGTAAASAPVVAFMDADMSVDPVQLPQLLEAIKSADVAIGSRSLPNSSVELDSPQRVVMGRTFNALVNALTNVDLKDTQCGFKAFRTPMARILFHFMVVDRFAFDVEVLSLARRLGMRIAEVPVHWREAGNSTVRPVADSISMAFDVLRVRGREKWPHIPALVVTADQEEHAPARERILDEAFGAFRKTDPVLPLPDNRALILLPLCKTNQVSGAASRLTHSSHRLTVRKRLVSCTELMEMMPVEWGSGVMFNGELRQDAGTAWAERRRSHYAARNVRHGQPVDLRLMSTLEV